MRMADPEIELVACGSSSPGMATFGSWEETVLEHTYDQVDYLSLHSYYGKHGGSTAQYLAQNLEMESFIASVRAICDTVKAIKRSRKTIYLSFDEWNVWYRTHGTPNRNDQSQRWAQAPRLLEEVYTFEDALVVGLLLNTLLRNCDRVRMACLAQLVNVIAPIMTETGGGVWKQTIYYPFLYTSALGRGTVLQTALCCEKYDTPSYTDVPYVDCAAVYAGEEERLTLFCVNRSMTDFTDLHIDLRDFPGYVFREHTELCCDDPDAVNTASQPDRVRPRPGGGAVCDRDQAVVRLQPLS